MSKRKFLIILCVLFIISLNWAFLWLNSVENSNFSKNKILEIEGPKNATPTSLVFSENPSSPTSLNINEYYKVANEFNWVETTFYIEVVLNSDEIYFIYAEGNSYEVYLYDDWGFSNEIESIDKVGESYISFAPATTKSYYIKWITYHAFDTNIGVFKPNHYTDDQVKNGIIMTYINDDWGHSFIYFPMPDTSGCSSSMDILLTMPHLKPIWKKISIGSGDSYNYNEMSTSTMDLYSQMYISPGESFILCFYMEGVFKIDLPEPPPIVSTQLYPNQKLDTQHLWEGDSLLYHIDLQGGSSNVLVEWADHWDMDLDLTVANDINFNDIIAFSDNPSINSPEIVDAPIDAPKRIYIKVHSKTGSGYFSILVTPDSLSISSPNSGSSWEIDTTHTISWTWVGSFTTVDIDLYKGGTFMQSIAFDTPNDGSFTWLVPGGLTEGSDYSIKVFSEFLIDESDQFTVFHPTITITNPTTATSWQAGTSQTISWSTTGTITSVNIKLYKGSIFSQNIAIGTPNDGSYFWDIPYDLTPATDYSIFIESFVYFDESDQFIISDPPPESITILIPNSGTSWQAGTSQTISWSSVGLFTTVDIRLYKGGSFHQNIIEDTSNSGSYSWEIPSGLTSGSDYSVKIESGAITDESDEFTIYLPTITVMSPTSATSWETDTSQTISWSTTGTITSVNIKLYKGSIFNQNIAIGTPNDGSYSWSIPSSLTTGSDYSVKIESGAISDESAQFTIFRPTIMITTPTSTTSWKVGTSQTISWSTTGTITSVNIKLYKGSIFNQNIAIGTPNDGSYSWSIPSSLTVGSDYSVKIEFGAISDESDEFTITKESSSTVVDDDDDDGDVSEDNSSVPGFQVEILIIAISISSLFTINFIRRRKKSNREKNFS